MPRSLYNPIRSYHPDEYFLFKMLAGMRERKFHVDPKLYVLGAYAYPLGAALKGSEVVGLVTLTRDVGFYVEHPEDMAKLYLVGRVLNVLLSAGAIVLVFLAARRLWGRAAAVVSAVVLAVSPLLVMHGRFMYDDVPGMFWVCVTILASVGILKKGSWRSYILAGAAAGLAVATKLFHGFVILLPVAADVFRERRPSDDDTPAPNRRRLLAMILLAAVIFLAINPYWVLNAAALGAEFARQARAGTSFRFYLRSWCFGFGVLPLAAVGVGVVAAALKRDRFALILGGWLVGYYVVLSMFEHHWARYLMPALPAAAMMVGHLASLLALSARQAKSQASDMPPKRKDVPSKCASGLLLVTITVLSGPQIATDWDIISAMRREDSRTEAGRAIVDLLPAGATVAVTEEPWQFEMPPLDQRRYHVVVTGYEMEKLRRARPKAFIYSDLQSDPEVNPHPEIPNEPVFWGEISREIAGGTWRLIYETPPERCEPKFLSALWLCEKPPEDLRYVSPRVVVASPQ